VTRQAARGGNWDWYFSANKVIEAQCFNGACVISKTWEHACLSGGAAGGSGLIDQLAFDGGDCMFASLCSGNFFFCNGKILIL
jgi:hypothetical protein